MRIISGKLKGRRLFTPGDNRIRPTSDKVKEALFSMIAEYVGEGAVGLDLFSGTGNLGLEAISRGMDRVYFGDKSRDSLNLTRQNINYCKVEAQAVLLQGDYGQVLNRIKEPLDLIFLDPPYHDGILDDCIKQIAKLDLLAEDGVLVVEHDIKEVLDDVLYGYVRVKQRSYGNICITVYTTPQEAC